MDDYGTKLEAAEPTGWHLKREVNVGHIFATLTLTIGLISWGQSMDTRLTRVESSLTASHDAQAVYEKAFTARLDRIETKLDRIIERQQVR
jgi:hypothetical protein